MTTILPLITRLEAASGADRELDARLSHHFIREGICAGRGDDSYWCPASIVDGWTDARASFIGKRTF